MAGSLNKVMLIGRLGKDPETRTFQDGGRVVTFPLATSEHWNDKATGQRQERTEWHPVAIFNDALAEVATRHLKKGSLVYLEGRMETRSWDKNGEKRYATEVVLRPFGSDLQMIDRAPDRPADAPPRNPSTTGPGGRK